MIDKGKPIREAHHDMNEWRKEGLEKSDKSRSKQKH
jgi:hypothetical protein